MTIGLDEAIKTAIEFEKKVYKVYEDAMDQIEDPIGKKVFKQTLKDSVKYVEAVTLGRPITYLAPKSEQAEAFRQIGKEVLNAQNL